MIETIKKAIYDLCVKANTVLPNDVFVKLKNAYETETNAESKNALKLILQNANMAYDKKMPLCQDTGQVLVFIKAQNLPPNIDKIINESVEKAYLENFFRQSIVKNALFDRSNTKTNTPCIIYKESSENDSIEINILIKGAGSENVSHIEMLSPTSNEEEIIQSVVNIVKKAGAKACPPYFIGVGIGGTMEYAGILSKKALILEKNQDKSHEELAQKIKTEINKLNIGTAGLGGINTALDVKILTDFTHIACLPLAVTINCHSSRHAKCIINKSGKIEEEKIDTSLFTSDDLKTDNSNIICVNTSETEKLKSLKKGQNILLSGEIYTARDAAHQRLTEMIKNEEELPFSLKDKIIFYAGPCPCTSNSAVGSIGPTTSARMDKYASILYEQGVLGTIGKGERSETIQSSIKNNQGIYFTALGGIACYMAQSFVKKELIAFEDLGTEAIYRFEIKDLPLRVNLI